MTRICWHKYAIELARTAARRSEDPYLRVGACVLRSDNSVAALGYNGAPPGVDIDWSDRDERRKRVVHAETNALRYVRPGEGALMATTTMPCLNCLALTRAHGIRDIVYAESPPTTVYDEEEIRQVAFEYGVNLWRLSCRCQ